MSQTGNSQGMDPAAAEAAAAAAAEAALAAQPQAPTSDQPTEPIAGAPAAPGDIPILPVKPKRPTQNGQVRPEPGSRTGLVWDYADSLYNANLAAGKANPVPTIGEVKELYMRIPAAMPATCQTQYGRWVIYHGFRDLLKARRA